MPEDANQGRVRASLRCVKRMGALVLFALLATGCQERKKAAAKPEVSSASGPQITSQDAARRSITDPRQDGWDSEAFAEDALAQLNAIAAESTTEQLASLVTADFHCTALRPPDLLPAFQDGPLSSRKSGELSLNTEAFSGPAGFAQALKQLFHLPDSRIRFKLTSVDLNQAEKSALTTAVCELASGTSIRFEAHATWTCAWQIRKSGKPLLRSIELRRHQEAELVATGPGNPAWFVDATEAVLNANSSFREQVVFGMQHWLGRIERIHVMLYFQRCGLAVGDANGDGLDDLYLCQPGGLPNRLFLQNPDGTARDQSVQAGVDWLDHTASALFLDLDNDGDQDLALATVEGLQLLANDGPGIFHRKATLPTPDSDLHSLSAADYDNDGQLDLYLCLDYPRSNARPGEPRPPFNYHDANDGGANILFRNLGDWKFKDVTIAVGLDQHNRRHSLAAAWEDYDNDGDQDLYVANDYGLNCLYRNDAGEAPGLRRFTDVANEASVTDPGSGMSADWGDYNRDGFLDLYVGNMFSSAGSRITRQDRFRATGDQALRPIYQRFAKGNSLFANNGNGTFRETGADAGVELGRWAWSSIFGDFNNDGWEDLFVANGFISTPDTGDL